jgi:predicted ATPase
VLAVRADLELGRHAEVVVELQQLVEEYPTREQLRHAHMLALYRCGRQTDALEAYREARDALVEQLGIEPGPELRELQRRILEHDPALDAPIAPTGRTLPAPPTQRTGLVGRERELDELADLLVSDHPRLLTVTGWGGVGKTRLATVAATRSAAEFDDVAWVELASVADASLVPAALEAAFEAGGGVGDPVDAVARVIGERRLLLVLDNFEHVLDASSCVATLLQACERLTILVTSRAALGVYGEQEYVLQPFTVPSPAELDAGTTSFESDALQLFIQRARATGSRLVLSTETAPIIAQVCARVDGLPLGIELAASRARLLSPGEILQRLEQRLALLTSGPEDLPDRQRSLRAAIEWSYDLLDDGERTLFRSLGAFVGGCTVEAALAVAGADVSDIDALDRLDSLVSKNLVARETNAAGEVRLTLLESIAEFARSLLDPDPACAQVRSRHARWYHAIAVAADTPKHTPETILPRARLRAEVANVRSAFDWALEHDATMAAEIAAGLAGYLVQGATSDAAAEVIDAALGVESQLTERARARLRSVAGDVAQHRGRPEEARRHRELALEAYERLGDDFQTALVLHGLAEGAVAVEAYEVARGLLEEAARYALHDPWMQALIANQRGCIAGNLGELDVALGHVEIAADLFRRQQDVFWSSMTTMNLGAHAGDSGDALTAIEHYTSALTGFRRGHYWQMVAHTTCNLVNNYFSAGLVSEALEFGRDGVRRARETGDLLLLSFGLTSLAIVLLEQGDRSEAVDVALEALDVSLETSRFRFLPFIAYVIAESFDVRQQVEDAARGWFSVDTSVLVERCPLDALVAVRRRERLDQIMDAMGGESFEATRARWMELEVADRFVELGRRRRCAPIRPTSQRAHARAGIG